LANFQILKIKSLDGAEIEALPTKIAGDASIEKFCGKST
jgi:hypothetical protein